ncbi:MAG: hypothetical protein RJQ09_11105 [Cyclobacteriaceae bacterium]
MVVFGFYGLSVIMVLAFWVVVQKSSADEASKVWFYKKYILWFTVWISYLLLISSLGFLNSFALPPRIPLMVVLPSIVAMILVLRSKHFQHVIGSIPAHVILYLQSFRILVELLIYGAFLNGVFPKAVTFEGTNFDILVGISALLIGFLSSKNSIKPTVALTWNIISIAILGVTVATFIYTYYFSGVQLPFASEFASMPYLLLPGVLLPFAIFLHAISIKQNITSMNHQ